jgi:DEAD/DEAH box helicase
MLTNSKPVSCERFYCNALSNLRFQQQIIQLRSFSRMFQVKAKKIQKQIFYHKPFPGPLFDEVNEVPYEIRKNMKIKGLRQITRQTQIQVMTRKPALQDNVDVVGIAPENSGKTLCYMLPIFQKLLQVHRISKKKVYIIVITPTMKHAEIIEEQASILAANIGLKTLIYAGDKRWGKEQATTQIRVPQIAICTPDRLLEMLEDVRLAMRGKKKKRSRKRKKSVKTMLSEFVDEVRFVAFDETDVYVNRTAVQCYSVLQFASTVECVSLRQLTIFVSQNVLFRM